jgi:cytochrome P450
MDQRRKAIFVAFHDVIPGTTYVKPGESWSPELRHAFDRTMEEIRAIIEERRVSPRSDFISDLINARDQGDKLSDSELFDQIFGSAAPRCRQRAVRPAALSTCSTRTPGSWIS